MNTKTLKDMGAAVSLLVGIGTASPALATSTGPQALGVAANATDVWTFSCPAGVGASARVSDTVAVINNPALMQVVLGENSFPTVEVTDFAEGGPPSVFAVVNTGPGLYAMAFKKTAVGADSYIGEAFCLVGGAFNPVLGLTRRINQ